MDNNLWSYLRLLQIKGLGVINARKLINYLGAPSAIFEEHNREKLREILKSHRAVYEQIVALTREEEALLLREIDFMHKQGIHYVGIADKNYPFLLGQCADAPIVLFCRGTATWSDRNIAIVGTRKATAYGLGFTQSFVENIQEYRPTIISGLALGIDIKAHLSALENNLNTIAVMGTSFATIYPKNHTAYSQEIEKQGLIISEYPSWTKSVPEHFVRRNRIIAGMANAVIIVQSPAKGGSLSTAFYANDYNREVFAVPARVEDTINEGCMWLIQQNRAQLLLKASDVAKELHWQSSSKNTIPITASIDTSSCTKEEKNILQYLIKEPKLHIDQLCLLTQMPMQEINALLMMLEIKGLVKSYPGKMFGM